MKKDTQIFLQLLNSVRSYDKGYLEELEREWYLSQQPVSVKELAVIFPEAKKAMKQQRYEALLELKACYEKLGRAVKRKQGATPEARPLTEATIELLFENDILPLTDRISKLEWNLHSLQMGTEEKAIDIEKVRKENDLRGVMERYGTVFVKRTGKNWTAKCPFHGKDNHPSMSVSEHFGYCFSCLEHFDVFGFVQKTEHCSFGEALRKIASP